MHPPLVDTQLTSQVGLVLDDFFKQSIADATAIDQSYEQLWKHLYELFQSGGKRLRSEIALLSYIAFEGKDPESIIPIAAAQELLHFSLLIHDDIIDLDDIRYGVANISGRYKQVYSKYINSDSNLTHYAHSAAILAGDLLLSGAHQLIASSALPGDMIATAQHLLSSGIFEVAGGELLDTELSFMPYKQGDALKVAAYKTASYSFTTPLLTGAKLANASQSHCEALRRYAQALGVAYQLTDDLLGTFGDEQQTGKPATSDLLQGKRTYLIEVALESLSSSTTALFMKAFGNPGATAIEIEQAKHLLSSSGARQKIEQTISQYANQAITALDSLQLPHAQRQQFIQVINRSTNRDT